MLDLTSVMASGAGAKEQQVQDQWVQQCNGDEEYDNNEMVMKKYKNKNKK